MLPAGARRPRAHPRAAAAPPGRLRAGRRRPASRCVSCPFVGDRRLRPARPARRRRAARHRPGRQPALGGGAAADHDAAARAARDRRPATSAAARRASALFETGAGVLPDRPSGSRRRSCGVDWRPDDAELRQAAGARCPRQPLTLGGGAGRRPRRAPAGGARAAPASWADAIQVVREVARVLGVDVEVVQAAPRRRGTPAAAPQLRVGGERARPRRRAAPRGLRGLRRARRAPAPSRSTSTCLIGAAPGACAGADLLDVPGGQGGRRARRRRRPCPPPTWPARCARAPGRCWSRCGSSTSTPAHQIGAGKKSLAFALRFRAPDRTLTEAETAARARDARPCAGRQRAERLGAVQRLHRRSDGAGVRGTTPWHSRPSAQRALCDMQTV